jgi:hypothetical protein
LDSRADVAAGDDPRKGRDWTYRRCASVG